MTVIACIFISIILLLLLPSCIICYSIVQKKIEKSNDVGTKTRLIEFSKNKSDSVFYCETDIDDPRMILAAKEAYQTWDQEETKNDEE